MSKNSKQSKPLDDDEFANHIVQIGLFVLAAAFLAVLFYTWIFWGREISSNTEHWGQFGDYFGGIVNPIVGLSTVMLVIISINIQRKELRASLKEMQQANEAASKMSFEQSLFAWLENYHSQIRDLSLDAEHGRRVLELYYYSSLSPLKTVFNGSIHAPWPGLPLSTDADGNQAYIRINAPGDLGLQQMADRQFRTTLKFSEIYRNHRSHFDAPFRTLYRLIMWVDKSPLSTEQKWHYCALIRSQLSWIELVCLYYNSLIQEGEKFAYYANKYAVFDNLIGSDELIRWAVQELTQTIEEKRPRVRDGDAPWPFTPSAFDSQIAKGKLGIPLDL